MFDELSKYKNSGHFFFTPDSLLEEVCNAPIDSCGVYLVYELKNDMINLVHIGSTGMIQNDGRVKFIEGGMFYSIVHEKQFAKPRKDSWKQKMQREGIDALDVYWYETVNDEVFDIPAYVQGILFQRFLEFNGRLPKWNKAF